MHGNRTNSPKIYMEPQKPYIGKAILRKKNKAISIMFPDTTITLLDNRYIAQWNSIESSEINSCI